MEFDYQSSYNYDKPKKQRTLPAINNQNRLAKFASLRKWLLYICGTISGLVLLLLALGWAFSDTIGRQAIIALNEELISECKVKHVKLSFFRSFPKATIVLADIELIDAFGKSLLTAQEIDLGFDALSLLSDHIILDRIALHNGTLRLITQANGKVNWDIINPSAPNSAQPMVIDLRDVRLLNTEIVLSDLSSPYHLECLAQDARLKGRFNSTRFGMSSDAALIVHTLRVANQTYLAQTPVHIQSSMLVDMTKNAYLVKEGNIELGRQNRISIQGLTVLAKNHTDIDLKFENTRGDISLLLHLLPAKYSAQLGGLASSGAYYLKGTAKGRYSTSSYPTVHMKFGMDRARIMHKNLQHPLEQVNFHGEFALKPDGNGSLQIPDFHATCAKEPLYFNLLVQNFRNPYINFSGNGKFVLHTPDAKLQSNLACKHAEIHVQKLNIQGPLASLTNPAQSQNLEITAHAALQHVSLNYQGNAIEIPSAKVMLTGNQFNLQNAQVAAAGSDAIVHAQIKQFLPWVLNDMPLADAQIQIEAQHWDINRIMQLMQSTNQTASQSTTTTPSQTNLPHAKIDLHVKQLNYNQILAENVHGTLITNKNQVVFKAKSKAMKGQVAIAGCLYLDPQMHIELNAGMQQVDLATTFKQANNFTQTVVTHENISGNLTGRVAATAFWDKSGNLDYNKLVVQCDLLAHNGQLKNVEAFAAFSRFLHEDDLRNIKFTTLQNYIEVRNNTVYLPAMYIRNNACNMTISGQQSFNNEVNYAIKVNAGQALFNRLRKPEADGKILAANDNGLNLYYTMTGNLDRYKITMARNSAKQELKESEARKHTIAAQIDAAFERHSPDFKMEMPYAAHDNSTDVATEAINQPVLPIERLDTEPSKTRTKPRPKQKSSTSHQTHELDASKIHESSDEEFLDEIVGGALN